MDLVKSITFLGQKHLRAPGGIKTVYFTDGLFKSLYS